MTVTAIGIARDRYKRMLRETENYYETLASLGEDLRLYVLGGLRDMALGPTILDTAASEKVLIASLLRDIPFSRVHQRLHSLATATPLSPIRRSLHTSGRSGGVRSADAKLRHRS